MRALLMVAIEAGCGSDWEHLLAAVRRLPADDLCVGAQIDEECGQAILSADSEAALAEAAGRLGREAGISLNIGAPQVAYRETLRRETTVTHTHQKQTGAGAQYAEVTIAFEPLEPDTGGEFVSEIADGALSPEHVAAVKKGVMAAAESGLMAGFPVIGFRARLLDGKQDEASSAMAFEIAGRAALREAAETCQAVLLEPIIKLEAVLSSDHAGGFTGLLSARRGEAIMVAVEPSSEARITARVPLANMLGEARAIFADHAVSSWSMTFDHYAPVPLAADDPDPTFPGEMAMRSVA